MVGDSHWHGACATVGSAGRAGACQEGPQEGLLSPSCAGTSATSPGVFCPVTSSPADGERQVFWCFTDLLEMLTSGIN